MHNFIYNTAGDTDIILTQNRDNEKKKKKIEIYGKDNNKHRNKIKKIMI